MKKIMAIILVAVLVVMAVSACGNSGGGSSDGPLRVMLSNAYYTAPYCGAYNRAAREKAEELGIELTILDGEGNQMKQLEHANTAIDDGYDGFLYFPADVDGAAPIIEAMNDSGMVWMGVNAFPGDDAAAAGMEYYFGPDSSSHGVVMAQAIIDEFPEGANIVAIEGTAGHMQTIMFNRAFDDMFDYSKYIFLDKQDADFQSEIAMTKMADMITTYGLSSSGGQIDAIISHDGGILVGIVSALEAAGYQPGDVFIVVCGSNKIIEDSLRSGWLSVTSTQDPEAEGAMAVELIHGLLTGTGNVQPGWTKLPTPPATLATIDEFNWFS